MIDRAQQQQLADDLIRRLASALRGAQLYASGHPLVGRNINALADAVGVFLSQHPSVTIGLLGDEVVVDDAPVPKAAGVLGEIKTRLQSRGVQRVTIQQGVEPTEIRALVAALNNPDTTDVQSVALTRLPDGSFEMPHVRVGRILVEERLEASVADMATIRRLYDEAVSAATRIWEGAQSDGIVDPEEVRKTVHSLAQAVAQNRTALLSLTALRNYDNYTFTHMVNVSILTMGQARGLGIDGPLLREFGMAGLMHDIGKIRTPTEILTKSGKLTDEEVVIMRRHVLDGAEMLRRTSEMPPLVPIVAFEHHLRSDGSGYPEGVARRSLNLCTQMCSIADVYDAMRTERSYQQSFPTDRILAVLRDAEGHKFDQHLVRRFVQLLGIYPAGNLVRLDTGVVAVVLRAYPVDPYRPRVRVIIDKDGNPLESPWDLNLWEHAAGLDRPTSVTTPVDPAEFNIDPLDYL
jgi:putative nucleotidyltransferase with HDIG domain